MPGRLIMEQQHTPGSQDLKKEGNLAEVKEGAQKQETVQRSYQNGVSVSNGVPAPSPTCPNNGLQSPPELDQSWRESDANKPMGVLIERLAQQCVGDLNDALTKMAEVPEIPVQANGNILHTTDQSEGSLTKKRTLMEFAHNQRDRFIKTLVLSDWARNADDMARLVDLKVWQEKQVGAQRNAMQFIGVMKTDMAGAKMPNPNIEGALELLATGKASRMPDLGYLPAKRLTAKQLLRTLQDMNVTLATRLNIDEELPFHFSNFSIANGRATFLVPHEFEVDLSVADEDPSSPFYFIDVRFLFHPTPNLSDEGLRGALEERINFEMSTTGPEGCYELLHNFVLTHKINTLRNQANTLLKEKWFDCLSIELRKRVLIIQYWSGLPGPKSWLEIGVSTGKATSTRLRPATPQIDVRWFRRSREVDDSVFIDWQDISAETVLATITARHISRTLTNIRDRMLALADETSKLTVVLNTSVSIPDDCSLSLSLPGLRSPLTVRVAGVTGRWSLGPASSFTARTERMLNAGPNADPVSALTQLLCSLVQDRVSIASDLAGWKTVPKQALVPLPPASVTRLFGSGVISRSIFRCSAGWGESWALIATFGLAGEKWWATRLESHRNIDGSQDPTRWVVAEARPISAKVFDSGSVSRAQLLRVEKLAAADIALAILTKELREQTIRYKVEKSTSLAAPSATARAEAAFTAVVFDAAALAKSTANSSLRHFKADAVRLTHTGVSMPEPPNGELAEMKHCLRLTAKPGSLTNLQAYLKLRNQHADIAMNMSGALTLQLRTPFGQPYMKHITSKLEACARLNEYLTVLNLSKLEVLSLSLEKFAFSYSDSPQLAASLKFAGSQGSSLATLRLDPTDNPQHRGRVHLQYVFNTICDKDPRRAFVTMIRILKTTLPAYQAFDKIEAMQPMGSAGMHVLNPLAFALEYRAPLPSCKFQLHLNNRGNLLRWNVSTPLFEDDGLGMPDSLRFALLRLCQDHGDGWFGDGRRALVVESHAIFDVLIKVDETVREFVEIDPKSEPNGIGATAAAATTVANGKMKTVDAEQQRNFQQSQGHDAKGNAKQQPQRPAALGRTPSNVKKEVIELD